LRHRQAYRGHAPADRLMIGDDMHTVSPDLVAMKTAMRQMKGRLEQEAGAAVQWANLARNRKIPNVPEELEEAAEALRAACGSVDRAVERILE